MRKPKTNKNMQDRTSRFLRLICECKELYIGETGRSLAIRLKEHDLT